MKNKIIIIIPIVIISCCINNDNAIKNYASIIGSIKYHVFENVTENYPIYIMLCNSEDYTKPVATHAVHYPDTTFEITELPAMTLDMILYGDNIISTKICDILIGSNDEVIETDITVRSTYELYNEISPCKILVDFKDTEIDSISASNILKEYNCTLISFTKQYDWYLRYTCETLLPECLTVQEYINKMNNDNRVYIAQILGVFRSDLH